MIRVRLHFCSHMKPAMPNKKKSMDRAATPQATWSSPNSIGSVLSRTRLEPPSKDSGQEALVKDSAVLDALGIAQKQACEDNADAWAVHFMRQTRGADPNGGIRLFNKFSEQRWQSLTQQFTSDHS